MIAAASEQRRSPLPVNQPPVDDRSKVLLQIRFLIWTYLVLLIFEGSLRKWVAPQLSNPLLLIRDPVVIVIYLLALRARIFPSNAATIFLGIIAVISSLASLIVFLPYFSWGLMFELTMYGFRCNFLHLPLIFVMAKVFDENDVKNIGWFILLLMVPMSLIMVAQFKAAPDAFINRTVGLGEAQQLTAGSGKIRPAGTFSFISGPVYYITVAAAFFIYGTLTRTAYKTWMLLVSGLALLVGISVSGSRACVVSVILVVLSIFVILIIRPKAVNQFGRVLLISVVGLFLISRLPVFKEGVGILSDRFTESAEAADTTIVRGLVRRTVSGFTEGLRNLDKPPILGYGLGVGTAGGSRLLLGRAAFLLAEDEWSRVLLESGPIMGLAFLLWRVVLTLRIGYLSVRSLRGGAILPIVLFSCSFLPLLNGQLGQPTTLGFAVFLSGLCLAAIEGTKPSLPEVVSGQLEPAGRPVPRRSAFATRLHGPDVGADTTNGFVDR